MLKVTSRYQSIVNFFSFLGEKVFHRLFLTVNLTSFKLGGRVPWYQPSKVKMSNNQKCSILVIILCYKLMIKWLKLSNPCGVSDAAHLQCINFKLSNEEVT